MNCIKAFLNLFEKQKPEQKPEKVYLAKCGHESKKCDKVEAFGEHTYTTVPLIDNEIEYCHKCLSKMAIQCARCSKPIFIGDPITLCSPSNASFEVPEHAVVYKKDPLTLVGCGRTTCADTGADYCGRWIPPGEVKRSPSLLETAMANPGSIVIGNNMAGRQEIKVIKRETAN